MRILGVLLSAVGFLFGLAVVAAAVLGELYNGCETGPCGSPLWLLVVGVPITLIFAGIGLGFIRDRDRPGDPPRDSR